MKQLHMFSSELEAVEQWNQSYIIQSPDGRRVVGDKPFYDSKEAAEETITEYIKNGYDLEEKEV